MARLRKTESNKVASVLTFRSDGSLLFGKRNDNNLWSLPGGHFEVGETPEEAARRELWEEAGYEAEGIKYLGQGQAGFKNDKTIYVFIASVEGEPDASNDPDKEFGEWRWVDPDAIPEDILSNLHSPKNIALQLLNKQHGDEESLDKALLDPKLGYGIKHTHWPLTNGDNNPITHTEINVHAPGDEKHIIGTTSLRHMKDGTLQAGWTEVAPDFRRQGIASAMYAHAEKVTGKKVVPASTQSDDARDLWEANAKTPQFGHPLAGISAHPALGKLIKDKLMAVAAAASVSTSAMAGAVPSQEDTGAYKQPKATWNPKGLHTELHPIAHLESSFGKRLEHLPHSKGEYHSAYGAVGFKPVTAHELYNKSKAIQTLYPNLQDQNSFVREFKTNPAFYNTLATSHWNKLRKLAGGDISKAAFAWRWGSGHMARTDPLVIESDPYVQAFKKLTDKLTPKAATAMKSAYEVAFGQWLQKASKKKSYWRSKDGIRIPAAGTEERQVWNGRYEQLLRDCFGSDRIQLRKTQVNVSLLEQLNTVTSPARLALYSRMIKGGDVLPPIVVQRSGNGYNIVDGNHRFEAARDTGMMLLDAFELVVPDVVNTNRGQYRLYDIAEDEFQLFHPKMKQTDRGQLYEPIDLDEVKAHLRRLGYHGYRGLSSDPNTFVYFAEPHLSEA